MKAVFLDRDGVINRYPGDRDYVKSWEEFEFLPRVKTALKRLNQAGFAVFVISNQAGVSKGIYSQESLDRLTQNMISELSREQIRIAGVYYCTHRDEDHCSCRKPKTGLIDRALSEFSGADSPLQRHHSYFIGDTLRDMEAGKKAGLRTILVFSGKEKPENSPLWPLKPDFTAADLFEAVQTVLK